MAGRTWAACAIAIAGRRRIFRRTLGGGYQPRHQLHSLLGKTVTDHLNTLQKQGIDNLFLTFDRPGTHLVTLSTNSKYIELEAHKFEDYLKEDGLEHIRQMRRQTGQSERPGREFYRRDAATLIQVGGTPTAVSKNWVRSSDTATTKPAFGYPGSLLTFQIWFRKPLSGHWCAIGIGRQAGK
ncbi:MAG: hypothetical protein IPL27_04555 [Lewinellaceae bacterium]|nr:hypothetical protein [Lewinellaceae bacterium]